MSGFHTCQLESLRRSLVTGDEETLLDIVVGGVTVDGASVGVTSSGRRERVKHCSAADVLLLGRAHNLLVIDALYTYNRR
jgi:hypothetical protein